MTEPSEYYAHQLGRLLSALSILELELNSETPHTEQNITLLRHVMRIAADIRQAQTERWRSIRDAEIQKTLLGEVEGYTANDSGGNLESRLD